MEALGLIMRATLPPPAASTVYELSDLGRGLIPVVEALRGWEANLLGPPRQDEHVQLPWLAGAMMGSFRPEAARGVRETYEFRIGRWVFQLGVDDGAVWFELGSTHRPDLVFSADKRTLAAVISRQLSPSDAVSRGQAELEGDPEIVERWLEILGLPPSLGGHERLQELPLSSRRVDLPRR